MNTIISNKQQIQQYYQTLFGDLLLDDEHEKHWISINCITGRSGTETTWCSIGNEQEFIEIVEKHVSNRKNVYVGLGLRVKKLGDYKRGSATDVGMLPGVWVEIDYGTEGHKSKQLPPTLEDALSLVNEFPLEPTMVVHSGNGIHAYWLFKEFWMFEPESPEWDRAVEFTKSFQLTIKHYAKQHGWHVDSTFDIARILRVAGTYNFKEKPKKVNLMGVKPDNRYELDDLEQFFEEFPEETATKTKTHSKFTGTSKPGDWPSIVNGCAYVKYAVKHAESLPEPDWYKTLSIAVRSKSGDKNGHQIAHEISRPYPNYSVEETDKKIQQALENTGPYTCKQIADETLNEYCAKCSFKGKITSPIVIGTAPVKTDLEHSNKVVQKYLNEIFAEKVVSKRDRMKLTEFEFIRACGEIALEDWPSWETIKIQVKEAFGNRAQIKSLDKQVMNVYRELRQPHEEKIDNSNPKHRYFREEGNQKVFIPVRLTDDVIQELPLFSLSMDIFYYQDGKYHPNGDKKLRQLIRSKLGELTKRAYSEETLYDIRTVSFRKEHEINQEDGLISVKNGLLNWETGELLPHTADRLSTIQLPVTYDPDATCENIKRFFSEIASPEDVITLEEWFGYHLMQNAKFHKGAMFLGEGSNGKSVLLELLGFFIGAENTSNVSLQDLEHDKFKRAKLFGKMANINADIPATRLDKSEIVKKAITGDVLDGEFKGVDSFSFRNFAKLTFSANEKPGTADITEAFFRRWILINFPNKFIAGVNADPNLLEKITTPNELSGLLNLAIKGLKRLHEQGSFSISETSQQLLEEWKREADNVAIFVAECCVQAKGTETYRIEKEELHRIYKAWAVDAEYKPKGRNNFYKRIMEICPSVTIDRKSRGSKEMFIGVETTFDISRKYKRLGFENRYAKSF